GARMEHVLKYQRWLGTDIPNADPALMAIYCQADPDNPLPPVLQKMAEVLRGPTADFELKTVIGAYREARHKTEVELERAQDDLKKVVTVRQELILIRMGILR
ncbi:MAG TPA: hypothetical protein VHM90_00970, partial [Phycisphaerae bacterium]|nr:hypothetical protein [Phycisphaerae bacterium]